MFALVEAVPRSARIITTAGIALGGSVGLVAIIPLWPFQEIAFTLTVGLLLDVFVVRLLLVPSLITLVGPVSRWPPRAPRPAAPWHARLVRVFAGEQRCRLVLRGA